MSTSNKKIVNKPASDPIDRLIYEKGLRIKEVLPVKNQDKLIVFLNNGNNIMVQLSAFARLKKATQKELGNWKLISKGIGIEWSDLDEDLSLKGLLNQVAIEYTIRLAGGENTLGMAA
jgi:hypothetical protein